MRVSCVGMIAAAVMQIGCALCGAAQGPARTEPYPAMAALEQYMVAGENEEIALARSAAPASISADAAVMVLRREGYVTAAQGKNGFVCLVERSWGTETSDPQFWNPRMRAPHCFNAAAVRTFLPIYLLKTKMVLAGESKAKIHAAIEAALDSKTIPAIEPGAMAYMMSKQQYLNDRDMGWHPHVMFFFQGDQEKRWAADRSDSPVIAGNDAEERVTILFVVAGTWSDGTKAPAMGH